MLRVITSLLACLSVSGARELGKALKTMPIVTNSLVNLGKMDIAFYFNARPQDLAMHSELADQRSNLIFSPKVESSIVEPCPCSSLKYMKDSTQSHPSEILNRILSGNDLFSFKEPTSSTLCCDSHENAHEDFFLEFGPKQNKILANQQNSFSFLPYLLDSMQNKPNPFMAPPKAKTLEIFIIPKQQGPMNFENLANKNKEIIEKDIKIVGDKEIKNDFKTYQFIPPFVSSVKKDLAIQEKKEHVTKRDGKLSTVDAKSNTV